MNSPSQELSQAELIALAKEAGATHPVRFVVGVGYPHDTSRHSFTEADLAKFAQLLLQREGEAEPVAWFAFADSNGPVPLELWGIDEKACKYAVLMNARAIGWKGTVEGYLLHTGWTIRPVYDRARQPTAPGGELPEGWKLVPIEPTAEIMASAAIAAWPVASKSDVQMAMQAADIVLRKSMDMQPGVTKDMLAATIATMAPAYRAMIAAAPSPAKEQG